jgi:hypothetical protein
MADAVRGIEYYYVTVPDTPGEGQRVLSALRESGVNLGLCSHAKMRSTIQRSRLSPEP